MVEARKIITLEVLKGFFEKQPAHLWIEILKIHSLPRELALERVAGRYADLAVHGHHDAAGFWKDIAKAITKLSDIEIKRLNEQCKAELLRICTTPMKGTEK